MDTASHKHLSSIVEFGRKNDTQDAIENECGTDDDREWCADKTDGSDLVPIQLEEDDDNDTQNISNEAVGRDLGDKINKNQAESEKYASDNGR